jgi:hypothetical protein
MAVLGIPNHFKHGDLRLMGVLHHSNLELNAPNNTNG